MKAREAVELQVASLQLGQIQTNCHVVHLAGDERALVVDPGDEAERVLEHLAQAGLRVEAILVTHCHWDHVGAVARLARELEAPVYMGAIEAPVLEQPELMAFPGAPEVEACRVDHRLDGGETLRLAGLELEVLLVPGHSPGHVAFLVEHAAGAPVALSGDVVFRGSIGRVDLPFADPAEMGRTLRMLVGRLDPATILHTGHGPSTTWAEELASNPFLRGL